MKLNNEEFKKKYSEIIIDEDKKIEFLEDFTDSFSESENSDSEDYKAKYEELQEKYKARFFDTPKKEEEKKEDEDEDEEKEIDVKEIF